MYKHPLFISWSTLLAFIAVLHIVALEFYLYWVYSWFDIMMHFLGGLFIGLLALWFFFESEYFKLQKSTQNIVIVVGGAIILVGIGWEVFEILAGISIEENFVRDTITDLLMDITGSSVAVFIFTKQYLKKQND